MIFYNWSFDIYFHVYSKQNLVFIKICINHFIDPIYAPNYSHKFYKLNFVVPLLHISFLPLWSTLLMAKYNYGHKYWMANGISISTSCPPAKNKKLAFNSIMLVWKNFHIFMVIIDIQCTWPTTCHPTANKKIKSFLK